MGAGGGALIDHTGRRGIQNTRVRIPNTKPRCSIDLPACTAHPCEHVHDTCALVLTSAAHYHDRGPHAWKVLWCERGGGRQHGDCPDPTQQAASCTPYLTYSMRPTAFTHSTPPQQIRINMLASTVIVWGRQKNTVHVQDIM